MLTGALEVLNLAARMWTEGVRRNQDDKRTQPFQQLHYGEASERRDPWALGSTLGSPSDPQDLGVRKGVIGVGRQSTASPIDARSLSPIPADGSLGGRKRRVLNAHSQQVTLSPKVDIS
jgi:hypothetical protein